MTIWGLVRPGFVIRCFCLFCLLLYMTKHLVFGGARLANIAYLESMASSAE